MASDTLDLNARRKMLKMPVAALVKRSGVSRPTVFRILRGNVENAHFGHVQRVARALGLAFGKPAVDPEEMRRREADRKARLVARLTQGTMGLEAQAVPGTLLEEIVRQTVAMLLADRRKLWE